jgi:hypothetical protein
MPERMKYFMSKIETAPPGSRTPETDEKANLKQKDAAYNASSYPLLEFGGPYATKLAPVYDEFLGWREVIGDDYRKILGRVVPNIRN